MKVNSPDVALSQNRASTNRQAPKTSQPKTSQEDIKAQIEAKFGVKVGEEKKKESPDVVVSINSKGEKKVEEEAFGDIKNNNPSSAETQEKLKSLLRSGGFQFNDKERAALSQILNK